LAWGEIVNKPRPDGDDPNFGVLVIGPRLGGHLPPNPVFRR